MGKVYLTRSDREAGRIRTMNAVLSKIVSLNKCRSTDRQLADKLGVNPASIWAWKDPDKLGRTDINTARALAHACGMSAADWLKFGGYE